MFINFFLNRAICEIMWENTVVRQVKDDNITRRMQIS